MRAQILLVILFYSLSCFSQKKQIDSLQYKVDHAVSDTQKVNNLNKLFVLINVEDRDSAKKIAEEALKISTKVNYPLGKATSYNNLGTHYYYNGNYTKALSNYLSAISVLESQRGNLRKSKTFKKQMSTSYNNTGMIHQHQKRYDKAEEYFNKSIKIDLEIGDKKGMAQCYNNIGTIKEETNKYDEAIKNYEISLQLKRETNDTDGIPSTLINMGIIRMNQNKFRESQDYFEKALQMSLENSNKQTQALALINLGDLFYLKKQFPESITYYQKGIEVCKNQNYDQFLSYAYQSISLSLYRMKNFEKAYDFFQKYVSIKDSINESLNSKVLNEMETKYQSDVKAKEIKLLTAEKDVKDLELKNNKTQIYYFIGGFLLLGFLVLLLLRAYITKRKTNSELDLKNQKIESAYSIIEQKQKEIVASINYAKKIQYTLLAHRDFLSNNLGEYFILYKPKDIVSGDFYWATKQGNKFFLAVCDSTGHGVPGSFMSLLNIGFFSEAINEKGIFKPNEVLNYVRKRLVNTISQEGQADGFDGILLCMDRESNTITYSAANNTPVIIENNTLRILQKDKMPVGIGDYQEDFQLFTIDAEKGSMLYLFTDGYSDQFGGEKGKKFMYKRLESKFTEIHLLPMDEQMIILDKEFETWRGDLEQVDDVCIFGLRV